MRGSGTAVDFLLRQALRLCGCGVPSPQKILHKRSAEAFLRDGFPSVPTERGCLSLPKSLFKVKEIQYNKRMRKKYPSDITRGQFEHIRGILESGKKKTAPRKADLYEIFCAILYLLKSGCQWRMLPETFPKWNTVYYYFSIWNKAQDEKPSLLHQCLKKIDWRGSYKTGAEVLQEQLSYSRCAEC